ncbi:MAG: hypothetical protein HQK83_08235 [Fibrobacteria bacterium]|nr:hypothetical protein [Fibrobacteria bacterium]
MLRRVVFHGYVLILLFGLITPAGSFEIYFLGDLGYSWYNAKDLNRFMLLLEQKIDTSSNGENISNGFDGKLFQTIGLGVKQKCWRVGFEGDYWHEQFTHRSVTALSEAGLGTGLVESKETYTFLPLSLAVAYDHVWEPGITLSMGYSFGILAGSAQILVNTEYTENSGDNDLARYYLSPGLTWQHKIHFETGWLLLNWLGLRMQGGYRFLTVERFRIEKIEGSSRVFEQLYNYPEKGDELLLESYGSRIDDEAVIDKWSNSGPGRILRKVRGEFSGFYTGVQFVFYWKIGSPP